ncbi:MAG: hypothetical protein P0111_09100 [Nitrospira sp.]|nr:hypothetical protein [Nitrospira sp.]
MTVEPISKFVYDGMGSAVVIPAQAGIQTIQVTLDARFREHDRFLPEYPF